MFNKKIVGSLLSHPSVKDKITNIKYKHDGYLLDVSFYYTNKVGRKHIINIKFDKTEGWFRTFYNTKFILTDVNILYKLLDGDIKLIKLFYKAVRLTNKKCYENIIVNLDELKIEYRYTQNRVYYQE